MLYQSTEEAIADNYFTFANDLVGTISLSLAATALQFDHPKPFAWFFLVALGFWIGSKKTEYRQIADRYTEQRYRGIRVLALLWRIKIFLIGATLLFVIAMGWLTKENIYRWCGY